MSKETLLKEFEINYLAEYRWKKDRINNLSAVDWLSQAIDQTREETIREVEDMLPLEYHPDGDSEKGYNACLSEIKIKLNKLKK